MPEDIINAATAGGEGQQNVNTATEQGVNAENPAPGSSVNTQAAAEKTFTQAQLDEIIKKRLGEERQRFENHPGMSWLNTQAQRYGMTVEQYIQAMQEAEEREQLNQLIQNNIPQEYAQEMLENRKFRQQYQTEREAAQQKAKAEAMYQEFLDAYPDVNPDDIPAEVWQEVQKGRNLLDAYIRHENKTLREKLNGFQTKAQATQANQANAQSSTGSAKSQGLPENGYISKEVFEANKGNQKWLYDHYEDIKKSMSKWRK